MFLTGLAKPGSERSVFQHDVVKAIGRLREGWEPQRLVTRAEIEVADSLQMEGPFVRSDEATAAIIYGGPIPGVTAIVSNKLHRYFVAACVEQLISMSMVHSIALTGEDPADTLLRIRRHLTPLQEASRRVKKEEETSCE